MASVCARLVFHRWILPIADAAYQVGSQVLIFAKYMQISYWQMVWSLYYERMDIGLKLVHVQLEMDSPQKAIGHTRA